MNVVAGQSISLPRFLPYPRFGRVETVQEDTVQVVDVRCGDPRCPSEHAHGPETWSLTEVEAVAAYQPRAPWEWGRLVSYNTPVR